MTCLVDVARHTPGLTSGLSARRAFLPGSALRAISRHLEETSVSGGAAGRFHRKDYSGTASQPWS